MVKLMPEKPRFLITIDTEGDNLWAISPTVSTRNASFLQRFQELCEKYQLKPTYLTNYEMANSLQFQELGKDIIARHTGEIGMHLHAWDTPPSFQLTSNDRIHQPYLIEYPDTIMREKIKSMTSLLEDVFDVKMRSHRAGRWAFDERYARMLVEFGYNVDCSVTPHISWRHVHGNPNGHGGTDYRAYPENAYFIDLSDISRSGNSGLLEIPVTIKCTNFLLNNLRFTFSHISLIRKALNYFSPLIWLRPGPRNSSQRLAFVNEAMQNDFDYLEFMIHSSEFMPAGSPYFPTASSIEKLYDELEILFETVRDGFVGCTLSEYYNWFVENHRPR
jgi:hypothetical protein